MFCNYLLLILFIFSFVQIKALPIDKAIDVVIVGGGEAGCHTAIELAKKNHTNGFPIYKITIVEKNNDLLWGTSQITPGRLGQGYHYSHIETALNYLQDTMVFMQKYPNCVVGSDLEKDHPIRRGRYVVMKTSKPEPSKVWEVYKQIQRSYEDLVNTNPNNKIWGEPSDFLKLIYVAGDQEWFNDNKMLKMDQKYKSKDELAGIINLENVAFVVETAEELLDWKQYREQVLNELAIYKNITVLTGTEALRLQHNQGQNFTIECKTAENQTIRLPATFPIICNWERSERLIKTLDITSISTEKMTNRLKSIITIKLPEKMIDSHSYFFCMGPYAMFSNLGNGLGKITYAPITNMQKIDASEEIPQQMQAFLSNQADLDQRQAIAEDILSGAKKFIPALTELSSDDIVDVGFGIVKTRGSENEININDPLGKIGERDYGWVREHEVNHGEAIVIENNAMKIVYSLSNAKQTAQIIDEEVNQILHLP